MKQQHTVKVVTLVKVVVDGNNYDELTDKVAECMENMDYSFDSTTEAEIVSTEIIEADTISTKDV